MKSLLIALSMSALSFTALADSKSCEIRIVKDYEGYSNEMMPKVEDIMLKKGYRIINDGQLYEDTHVTVENLRVRRDLIEPGNIIGVDYTNMNILSAGQVCEDWSISRKDVIDCSFQFKIYVINDKNKFVKIADIKEDKRVKASLFNSKKNIISSFRKNILERAVKEIPECN